MTALAAGAVEGQAAESWELKDNGAGSCGVKLVLKNPDLQEQPDGFIHASGWFFIQFQAVGAGAEAVKSFAFSFGKPLPDAAVKCDAAAGHHTTGAYLMNYRGDYTPEDGFFVPINTTLVRDDEYGAAVHAYDQPNAQGRELGRFYAKAKVENGCTQMQCRDKPNIADIIKNDKVSPWPRVLPGDGVQAQNIKGVTIEFAESVRDVQLYVNGNLSPLQPWEGRPMDDDIQPGNDNTPCGQQPSQICTKRVWGPSFLWTGEVEQNDVLRVVATDMNNNRVEKIIHLLDPNQGGIVAGDEVDVAVSVENSTRRAGPQQEAEFRFQFISVSSSEAHVNLAVSGYDESKLTTTWHPSHVVVKPGERAHASLIVSGNPGVTSGTFELRAKASWRSGGQDLSKEVPVTLIIGTGENVGGPTGNATVDATAGALEAPSDTPSLGLIMVLLIVSLVALAVRRRA